MNPVQPPQAGAIDLAGLKGPTQDQKEAVYAQLLDQLGLACHSCGAAIGEDGVEVVAIVEQRQGTQLGVNVMNWPYCSRECVGFQRDTNLLENIAVKLAVRKVHPVQWIKGGPEDAD